MYKSKVDTDTLNESILNMVKVLEKYDCSYSDIFPIKIEPYEFTISDEALANWKKTNKFDEDISAEQAFYKFKDKYKIKNTDVQEIRKIIAIRYLIAQKGYSSTKAVTISEDVPREAVAEFSECSEKFAEEIDVTIAYISRLERGSAKVNLTRLAQISSALKV